MIKGKKRSLLLLIFGAVVILLSGCAQRGLQSRNGTFNYAAFDNCQRRVVDMAEETLKLEGMMTHGLLMFQETVEEVLVLRESGRSLAQAYKSHINMDEAVPASLLNDIKQNMKQCLDITDRIAEYVSQNECWLQLNNMLRNEGEHLPLDPGIRLKGVMMALSGTLLLYDIYLSTIALFTEDDSLRRFLNQSDLGYGIKEDQLSSITNVYLSISNLLYLQESISFYSENIAAVSKERQEDNMFQYLKMFIDQSPSYGMLRERQADEIIWMQLHEQGKSVGDNLAYLRRQSIQGLSQIFGNTTGLVSARKGKLYNIPLLTENIKKKLKAGDILLEKTPFRLSDRMIPGHWGHAAIWVGTPEELIHLNIWDHPVVQKYHDDILAGRMVVEALRDGVQMNTLTHFMNVDDLGLLRNQNLDEKILAGHIIRALRQVGKAYDFNFDVESTDKIVCSELIYQAYTDIKWPTKKIVGRHTISPDNLAQKALGSGPFKLILFYHNGERVNQGALPLMESLMLAN